MHSRGFTHKLLLPALLLLLMPVFTLCKKEYSCEGCNASAQASTAVNAAPVARAGKDITVNLPDNRALLDAGASTDPDNNISLYHWEKVSGPLSVNIANADAVNTKLTSLVEGIYVFALKVTDKKGLFSTDTVQVTVTSGRQNTPEFFAEAGPNQILTLPLDSVYLDGSKSNPNGWSAISATYTWTQLSGPPVSLNKPLLTGQGYQATTMMAKTMKPGVYIFDLEVKTVAGTSHDQVTVKVVNDPQDLNSVSFLGLAWEKSDIYGLAKVDVLINSPVRHDIFTPNNDNKPVQVYLDLNSNGSWQLLRSRALDPYSYDAAPELLWIYSNPADFGLPGRTSNMKIRLP